MEGSFFLRHPFDIYTKHLRHIGMKEFTSREIDVIACIVCGRSRTSSSFLSIAPKTVTTHITNILNKIQGNSREDIINFVENSDKDALIRTYYTYLRIYFAFESILLHVSTQLKLNEDTTKINYGAKTPAKEGILYIKELEKHLTLIGINTCIQKKVDDLFSQQNLRLKENECIITYLSTWELDLLKQNNNLSFIILHNISSYFQKQELIVVLLFNPSNRITYEDSKVDFSEGATYYQAISNILDILYPKLHFEKKLKELEKNYDKITNINEKNVTGRINKAWDLLKNIYFLLRKYFTFTRKKYLVALLCLVLICGGIIFSPKNEHVLIQSSSPAFFHKNIIERSHLLKDIEKKLYEETGKNIIPIVSLVGMGGAGKTILARSIMVNHKHIIAYELNAETKNTLLNSFWELAEKLAQITSSQIKLQDIQKIEDLEKQKNELLSFIKTHLKKYKDWLLIFDNVESGTHIKDYLPCNKQDWGEGKIILTTRNSNIKYSNFLNPEAIIYVDELTKKEALTLFIKILFDCEPLNIDSNEKDKILNFLKNIPHFPLDVTVAAHYLKVTKVSYDTYLDSLKMHSKEFEHLQQTFVMENEYTKTRYSIVTFTLKKLIEANKEFKSILAFISLLDSQDIPKNLLNNFRNNEEVNNLLFMMKRHSLLTSETTINSDVCFSLHRSTHEIMASFLAIDISKPLLESMSEALEKYMDNLIYYEADLAKMRRLVNHAMLFLKKEGLENSNIKKEIKTGIGHIYFYLGEYSNSLLFLDQALEICSKTLPKEFTSRSIRNLAYLADFYGAMNAIGPILTPQAKFSKIISLLEETISVNNKQLKENKFQFSEILILLGIAYHHLGASIEKEYILKKIENFFQTKQNLANFASSINISSFMIHHPLYLKEPTFNNIKEHIHNFDQLHKIYEKSKSYIGEGLKTLYSENDKNNKKSIECWGLLYLGIVNYRLGEYDRAKEVIEDGFKKYNQYYQPDNIRIGWASLHIGRIFVALSDFEKAQHFFEKSYNIYEKHYGKDHIRLAEMLNEWSYVYFAKKDFESAENLSLRSLKALHYQKANLNSLFPLSLLLKISISKVGQHSNANDINDFKSKAETYYEHLKSIIRFLNKKPNEARVPM